MLQVMYVFLLQGQLVHTIRIPTCLKFGLEFFLSEVLLGLSRNWGWCRVVEHHLILFFDGYHKWWLWSESRFSRLKKNRWQVKFFFLLSLQVMQGIKRLVIIEIMTIVNVVNQIKRAQDLGMFRSKNV